MLYLSIFKFRAHNWYFHKIFVICNKEQKCYWIFGFFKHTINWNDILFHVNDPNILGLRLWHCRCYCLCCKHAINSDIVGRHWFCCRFTSQFKDEMKLAKGAVIELSREHGHVLRRTSMCACSLSFSLYIYANSIGITSTDLNHV